MRLYLIAIVAAMMIASPVPTLVQSGAHINAPGQREIAIARSRWITQLTVMAIQFTKSVAQLTV